MYVCICSAVTEKEIVSRVEAGTTTFEQMQYELGVSVCCGCCKDCVVKTMHEAVLSRQESFSE